MCLALPPVLCLVLAACTAEAADNRTAPAAASSPARNRAQTLESLYKPLAEAQRRQRLVRSVESERTLAREYASQGVLDTAFDHFQAALRLDSHDAASHEGLARIWRDWGFPSLGLASAYRAVYWAPVSASAQNTLGTLLSKLGNADEARSRFHRALDLEPASAYPLNNLCYLELQQKQPQRAVEYCDSALQRNPRSATTRNNLALALTQSGRLDDAIAVFDDGPANAMNIYNKGILLLAVGRPDSARDAFAQARVADPSFAPARIRLANLSKPQKER